MKPRHTIALVLLAVVAVGVWVAWKYRSPAPTIAEPDPPDDPRLTFATPYRNVRPGVEYVGDAACAACHAEQSAAYARHPMGRSMALAAHTPDDERLDEAAGNPFLSPDGKLQYSVERRDGRLFHREKRITDAGEVLYLAEHEVEFAIGSGRQGRSYLLKRDATLFMSPITWYAQRERWDLSPGFEQQNQHFTRPVMAECLFCHANFADHVTGTWNRYREPVFRGLAIGCERCHGPGELHVAHHAEGNAAGPDLDDTIVNPARLEPSLRDAVCEQCHLGGDLRIVKGGRDRYDYRPGLPLHLFMAVYSKAPGTRTEERITGHVEQMQSSHCYQASRGSLACISCHDPHQLPPDEEKLEYYIDRCLACHSRDDCSAAEELRHGTAPAENCIACHMPALSTEIAHAAMTDHRIPKSPMAAEAESPPESSLPLVHFHRSLVDPHSADALRDRALAIVRLSDEDAPLVTREHLASARSLLEAAVLRDPEDIEAREALAHVVGQLGQSERSLEMFADILGKWPQREFSLQTAAVRAHQLQRYPEAANYWRQALEISPWSQRKRQGLAAALAEQRRWQEAADQCRRALEIFPGDLRARQLLSECLLGLGQGDAAAAEFEQMLEFEPPQREELRRWFENHPLRRTPPDG